MSQASGIMALGFLPHYALSLPLLFIAVNVVIAVRRIWFHPLSKFPGPKLWAASRIPYVLSLLRGKLNEDMLKMHEKYGDVIRLAPNEISFGVEEAWKDIYASTWTQRSEKGFSPNDMPQNIVTTVGINVRARMRRLLAPSFNEQALKAQSPVLEMYASILVKRLQAIYNAPKPGGDVIVNMLDWVNFYSLDIIGDLAMGESFHCLDESTYHPWVRTLFNFIKGMIIVAAARFLPATEYLLQKFIPKAILERQRQHTEFTNTKILQRLELKTDRPDFLTPFLKEMAKSEDKMSLGEIQSTFAIILVAGSETTATTLLGIFYKLASHPEKQDKLYALLRERYASDSDINVESTKDFDYLDAIINEALRLCYAVPGGLPRISPPGGDTYVGHYIPEGTSISIRPFVVLHSERYFKRSWDFIPERWLPLKDRPKDHVNDCLSASQPFNLGPTSCIGKPLAWAEIRLVVAKVIWCFNVSMTEGRPFNWDTLKMMMVVEKEPLWLRLQRRGHCGVISEKITFYEA
ncbi:putative RNA polymerase II mediator complex component Srb8 [Pleomassaria siparia CBS 279.74]|uniref:Putative RNA polymerase II mediator complex component Srb8 n=1 Tax=Pleomassaria siparia CBS 279.74 TaxID=1314801 RepID=A0A6G1KDH1_9PLEO|nr:putative RNA polymerase II mediator complex component Srb8 [Pleomassaria siparia CBS 279.74]